MKLYNIINYIIHECFSVEISLRRKFNEIDIVSTIFPIHKFLFETIQSRLRIYVAISFVREHSAIINSVS